MCFLRSLTILLMSTGVAFSAEHAGMTDKMKKELVENYAIFLQNSLHDKAVKYNKFSKSYNKSKKVHIEPFLKKYMQKNKIKQFPSLKRYKESYIYKNKHFKLRINPHLLAENLYMINGQFFSFSKGSREEILKGIESNLRKLFKKKKSVSSRFLDAFFKDAFAVEYFKGVLDGKDVKGKWGKNNTNHVESYYDDTVKKDFIRFKYEYNPKLEEDMFKTIVLVYGFYFGEYEKGENERDRALKKLCKRFKIDPVTGEKKFKSKLCSKELVRKNMEKLYMFMDEMGKDCRVKTKVMRSYYKKFDVERLIRKEYYDENGDERNELQDVVINLHNSHLTFSKLHLFSEVLREIKKDGTNASKDQSRKLVKLYYPTIKNFDKLDCRSTNKELIANFSGWASLYTSKRLATLGDQHENIQRIFSYYSRVCTSYYELNKCIEEYSNTRTKLQTKFDEVRKRVGNKPDFLPAEPFPFMKFDEIGTEK